MSADQFLTWMFGKSDEDNDTDQVHTSPPANGFQKDDILERPRQNSESNDLEMLWQTWREHFMLQSSPVWLH